MSNPVLAKFDKIDFGQETSQENAMTVHGTAAKTGVLLALSFVTAAVAWKFSDVTINETGIHFSGASMLVAVISFFAAFICGLIGCFSPRSSVVVAPLYALFMGYALGAISAVMSAQFGDQSGFHNIVMQAVLLTFGVMGGVLALYASRIIKVTNKVIAVFVAGMLAILLFKLVMMVLGMCGIQTFSILDGSPLSIGISVVIVLFAAFRILINFHLIEKGAQEGAPRYMEWVGALGLMIGLVWLYLEILQLLAKLQGGDRDR